MRGNKADIKSKAEVKKTPEVEVQKFQDYFNNRIRVPKALIEEFESRGLDHRWINYTEFIKNGHMHKAYWEPYKPSDKVQDNQFGQDPNGYIRRGDLVLSTRPKTVTEQHKEMLRRKNERYKQHQKAAANRLRAQMRGVGKVYEGYDENGE